MSIMMNGGQNDYVGGDFIEDGSFLVLQGPSSVPGSPIETAVDEPPPPAATAAENSRLFNISVKDSLTLLDIIEEQQPQTSQDPLTASEASINMMEESVKSNSSKAVPGVQMDDIFSMTNYSLGSSSSSTDTQLDDLRKQLDQVVIQNAELRDLCEVEHKNLQKVLLDYEEMKESASQALIGNTTACEESRQKIDQLKQENDLLYKQIDEMNLKLQETAKAPQVLAGESDFEKLETMESLLSNKDEMIKQKDQQMLELTDHLTNENNRLKEIIRVNDQVIREKCEELRQKNDQLNQHSEFLSKSDESLARSLSEKDDLETKVGAFEKRAGQLEHERNAKEQEAMLLNQEVEAANILIQQLKNTVDELSARNQILEQEQQRMNVELATRKSEHENQLDQFRYNLQSEGAEKKRFELERQALIEELNVANVLLNEQKSTSRNGSLTDESSGNQTSISALPGQMFGFLKREVMGIGASPPSGQPSFEFLGASSQPSSAPEEVGVGSCPICNKSFDTVQRLQRHAANCGIEAMADRSDPFVFP